MSKIFSKDNITFAIAVLGFIFSLCNTIYLIVLNKRNLKVTCKKYSPCGYLTDKPIFFELIFENNSRRSISITRMFLNIDNKKFEFFSFPQLVYEENNKTCGRITSEQKEYSLVLPKTIDGFGVLGGFFCVLTNNCVDFKKLSTAKLSLSVHTNRGITNVPIPYCE